MSLLGKILALLNVVAAAAFLVLAAMDLGKRQAWSYAVLRHELVLHGVPVEASNEALPGLPADLYSANLSDTLLKDTFKGVEGPFVRTQLQEVERKRSELLTQLGEKDEATRRNEAGAILMNLARTSSDRAAVAKRLADPKTEAAALMADLQARFDEVTRPQRIEGNATPGRDFDERRRAIASLLYGLSPDPRWHDRVMVVIGLPAYSREADREGQALEGMIYQERLAAAEDRTNFEVAYSRLVQRLHSLDQNVRYLNGIINDLAAQKQKQDVLVKTRMTDKSDRVTQLEMLQTEYAEVLKEQLKLQNAVFQAQQDLATAADKNLQLERKIRYLELGR